MASLSLERLLLLVECPICFEKLNESNRMLPCQHTFCKGCLEKVIEKSGELRCPECRILHVESMNDLQPNILIMRILEYIEQSEKDTQKRSASQEQVSARPFVFTACESQEQEINIISVEPESGNLHGGNHFSSCGNSADTGTQNVSRSVNGSSATLQTSSLASAQIGNLCDRFYGKNDGKLLLGSTHKQKLDDDNIGSNVTSSGHGSSSFCFKARSLNTPRSNADNYASKVSICRPHPFPVELAKGSKGKIVASSGHKDRTLVRALKLSENARASNVHSRLSIGSSKATSLTIGKKIFTPIALPSSSLRLSSVKERKIAHLNLPSRISSCKSSKVTPSTIGNKVFSPVAVSGSTSRLSSGKSKVTSLTIDENLFTYIAPLPGLSKGLLNGEFELTPLKINKNASTSSAPSNLSGDGFRMTSLTDRNNYQQSSAWNCAPPSSNGCQNIRNNHLQSSTWNCAPSSSNGCQNIDKNKNVFTYQAMTQPKTPVKFRSGSNKAFQSSSNGPSQNNLKVAPTRAESFIPQQFSNARGSL